LPVAVTGDGSGEGAWGGGHVERLTQKCCDVSHKQIVPLCEDSRPPKREQARDQAFYLRNHLYLPVKSEREGCDQLNSNRVSIFWLTMSRCPSMHFA
jgi:hypothetical protein